MPLGIVGLGKNQFHNCNIDIYASYFQELEVTCLPGPCVLALCTVGHVVVNVASSDSWVQEQEDLFVRQDVRK